MSGLWILGVLGLLLLLPRPAPAVDGVEVFVSVPPQKFFARRVGGSFVTVRSVVPNGIRPDTFEPSVAEVRRLARAEVLFLAGVPYERTWTEVFRERFPSLQLVDCCPGVEFVVDARAGHAHHGGRDPHIWTSPRQAVHFARTVHRTLAARYPTAASMFADNLADLERDLAALDEGIRRRLGPMAGGLMIVAHPSLGYFAREYGLRQVSVEEYGREIRPAKLLKLIELAKRESVRQVYAQPQFNRNAIETLAGEIGARVEIIDPLSEDYLSNMEHISRVVRGL